MKHIVIIIFIATCTSCGLSKQESKSGTLEKNNTQIEDTSKVAKQDSKDEIDFINNVDNEAYEIIDNFFSWYIKEVYPENPQLYQIPEYKQLNDSTYIFNAEDYGNLLQKVKFFSKEFILQETNKIKECNSVLKKTAWEYAPEPEFNIPECNFLWSDRWIGGQGEFIDGYKIVGFEQRNSGELVAYVNILIEDQKFVESRVTLMKEASNYLINSIELYWE